MESKCPDETLSMRGLNRSLCILRMFEDTFPLGVAQILSVDKVDLRGFDTFDGFFAISTKGDNFSKRTQKPLWKGAHPIRNEFDPSFNIEQNHFQKRSKTILLPDGAFLSLYGRPFLEGKT